jgi:4-oxalocrotonate tautomerase
MPIVNIHILEGRTVEQKRKMVASVTKAISESIDVPEDKVRIIISNMAFEDFAHAGKLTIDTK